MLVWIVTVGEPIPTDNNKPRLLRTGILSQLLENNNHQVVWWNSDFDHTAKKHRFGKSSTINISENFSIKLLHGCGYPSTFSLKRLLDHYQIAKEFKKLSLKEIRPDIIVASFPTVSLSWEAINYAKKNSIPILIDYRDLWPEALIDLFPIKVRSFINLMLFPVSIKINKIFRAADGLIGITPPFLEYALQKAKRKQNLFDNYFNHGYPHSILDENILEEAKLFWLKNWNILPNKDVLRICLFSHIAIKRTDLITIIEVAKKLKAIDLPAEFVLCGNGTDLGALKDLAKGLDNIIFTGLVSSPQIKSMMKMSDLGILPYPPSIDFNNSIPNKVIEYLSGKLPVLSSVEGFLKETLENKKCGLFYKYNDPDSLFEKIKQIYSDKESLKIMGEAAFQYYNTELRADIIYGKYIKHLEFIVDQFDNESIKDGE